MFGLFQKKGGEPEEKAREKQREPGGENARFKEFSAQFLPEELSILAVTGANGFGGGKTSGEELWTASIGLTAWMEEDSPDIHRGEFVLSTIGDDQLLEILRRRTPRDFIVKFRGRVSEDGRRLLLLDLPEPGFDPDLKAILEEQKKPVTIEEEGLGVFTLNRQVNWFEAGVDWLGTEISLVFDREEDRAGCAANARALLASAADWDRRCGSTQPASCWIPPTTGRRTGKSPSPGSSLWNGWSRSPSRFGRTAPSSSGSPTERCSTATPSMSPAT